MSFINDIKIFYKFKNVLYICIVNRMRFVGVSFDVETYFSRKKITPKIRLKVIVTVISSGCLQIGFGPLIMDYICNFLI